MKFNEDQLDTMTEVINIGVGRAASALCDLVGHRIRLNVPHLYVVESDELLDHLAHGAGELDTSIVQDFHGTVSGRSVLAFPKKSGIKMAQVLADLDDEPDELDIDLSEILSEVGNILLNAVLGTIGNMLEARLEYTVPKLATNTPVDTLILDGQDSARQSQLLVADAVFEVSSRNICGSLVLVFDLGGIETILDAVMNTVAS